MRKETRRNRYNLLARRAYNHRKETAERHSDCLKSVTIALHQSRNISLRDLDKSVDVDMSVQIAEHRNLKSGISTMTTHDSFCPLLNISGLRPLPYGADTYVQALNHFFAHGVQK